MWNDYGFNFLKFSTQKKKTDLAWARFSIAYLLTQKKKKKKETMSILSTLTRNKDQILFDM